MMTAMQWIRNSQQPYLSFVVKGPEQTAREQMFLRGIVGATFSHLERETVFTSDMKHLTTIQQWFNESPELIPGFGYPNGTCLLFSIHENCKCEYCQNGGAL